MGRKGGLGEDMAMLSVSDALGLGFEDVFWMVLGCGLWCGGYWDRLGGVGRAGATRCRG